MCFSDFVRKLQDLGVKASASQVRWAINSGKISRPPLNGSLSFEFGPEQVEDYRHYYNEMQLRQAEGTTRRRKVTIMA